MKICLDRKIGAILASDSPIEDDHFLRCNGEVITRDKCPAYFKLFELNKDTCKLPDLTETESRLDHQVQFYIRCLL
jgi:hypothetical protein